MEWIYHVTSGNTDTCPLQQANSTLSHLETHSKDNKNAREIDYVCPFSWVTWALNLGLCKGYVIRSYFTSTSLGKSAPTDFLCDLQVVISHYATYIEMNSEHWPHMLPAAFLTEVDTNQLSLYAHISKNTLLQWIKPINYTEENFHLTDLKIHLEPLVY